MTASEIIDLLGGTSQLAETLGVQPSTVSNWRVRQVIPGEYWREMVAQAKRKQIKAVTFDALAGLYDHY
jgi:DNA-binding transcriptional regulator YdaS (Cro superfamily)